MLFALASCSNPEHQDYESDDLAAQSSYPDLFQEVLEAHGGLDKWKQMNLLEFDLYSDSTKVDHQTVDLDSRKVLISSDQYTIGYDGDEVWYTGEESEFPGSSARFYHNLQFYFFALPFVFADPGVNYEILESRIFQGKQYEVMRFTYGNGIGDSPEDEYIIYINPENKRMELLLYTVTYFSGEDTDGYGARLYAEWQHVNGLLVPLVSERYKWETDSLGDFRYASGYRNVVLEEREPDQAMFLAPSNAKVSE
ncbi:DUF6503 family protein [Catalinimonas alkaloidigena]|uniref:DUF6503 family protein n=1 Tax=Catalinimonas alkaloidigena TaxID=1075417 RepID=UPI002404B26E|nr:DUF6503 family protein [Catalinimonas alkaloidigena]